MLKKLKIKKMNPPISDRKSKKFKRELNLIISDYDSLSFILISFMIEYIKTSKHDKIDKKPPQLVFTLSFPS